MAKKTRRSKPPKRSPRKAPKPPIKKQPVGAKAPKPEAKEISQNTSAAKPSAPTQFIGAPIVDPSVIAGPVIEPKKAKPTPPPEPVIDLPEAEPVEAVVAEALIEDTTPEAEAAPEPTPAPKPKPASKKAAPAPKPEVVVKNQGFTGGLIGGVIAAALGVAAIQFIPDSNSTALQGALSDQSNQIESLSGQIAALSETAADSSATDALEAQIAELSAQLEQARAAVAEAQNAVAVTRDGLTARIDALATDITERVATLEKAPIEQAADAAVAVAVQAYESEVAALRDETRSRFDALSEDLQARLGEGNAAIVEALEANQRLQDERAEREAAARAAEDAARKAQAMSVVRTALETGAPFDAALQVLTDAPAPLPDLAAEGAPTSSELADAFPPLARTALTVALREADDNSMEGRAMTFFRTQLGIRSLTPQEGDDPDAVLSRMEAAVATGDYDTAVTEAAALPEAAQAVLADWLGAVQARSAALAAADALAAELNTN